MSYIIIDKILTPITETTKCIAYVVRP